MFLLELKDVCEEIQGLCTNGKCVSSDDGGYICECNEGFMNVAVEGGYRCQGRFLKATVFVIVIALQWILYSPSLNIVCALKALFK